MYPIADASPDGVRLRGGTRHCLLRHKPRGQTNCGAVETLGLRDVPDLNDGVVSGGYLLKDLADDPRVMSLPSSMSLIAV